MVFLPLSLSLSLSLSATRGEREHTHARTHTHTHARTRAHTHTEKRDGGDVVVSLDSDRHMNRGFSVWEERFFSLHYVGISSR